MADVSDPQIAEAYADIRKEGSDTNWMLVGYENNKKLVLVGKGAGGISEMATSMSNDACFFGFLKVTYKSDETTRTKFVFFSFKGDTAPVMRKGNMSVHVTSVKKVIKDFSIEYSTSEVSEVTEECIMKKIKASNY